MVKEQRPTINTARNPLLPSASILSILVIATSYEVLIKHSTHTLQNSQRKALRAWYYDDSNQVSMGRFKMEACSRWWQQTYGYHLNSFIASEIMLGPCLESNQRAGRLGGGAPMGRFNVDIRYSGFPYRQL